MTPPRARAARAVPDRATGPAVAARHVPPPDRPSRDTSAVLPRTEAAARVPHPPAAPEASSGGRTSRDDRPVPPGRRQVTSSAGALRGVAAVLAGIALTGVPVLSATPVFAAEDQKCAAPAETVVRDVPWAQLALAPERAWILTRGAGVVVGVVDTGVSARSPALAGAVLPGRDVSTNRAADTDCSGHGTFVAGLLAARPVSGSGLTGVAPGVRVLPIRVAADEKQIDPDKLAAGIRAAVDGGARVIAVATGTDTAPPALRAAVAHASAHDALVIASTDSAGLSTNGPVYPAALPGVVAVASLQSDGKPAAVGGKETAPTVAAPGAGLVSVAPEGKGNVTASGSGIAVAFVAGAAALVWDYRPRLKAEEVRHRLEVTADHPTGRLPDPMLGYGMIDPVAAVTTALPEESGETAPSPHARPVNIVLPTPEDRSAEHVAIIASAAIAGCAALGGLLVATIRRGRGRGWRPGTNA
jgi:membrane-anchored mycosin MYCP